MEIEPHTPSLKRSIYLHPFWKHHWQTGTCSKLRPQGSLQRWIQHTSRAWKWMESHCSAPLWEHSTISMAKTPWITRQNTTEYQRTRSKIISPVFKVNRNYSLVLIFHWLNLDFFSATKTCSLTSVIGKCRAYACQHSCYRLLYKIIKFWVLTF